MAIISLASTTESGFLEADFNQIKQLVQDGGTTPGTTSSLVTKTGPETLTTKTIQGATLSSTTVNSGTISGGTMSSATVSGGTLSSVMMVSGTVTGATATGITYSNPAAFIYYDSGNTGTGKTIDWNNGAYQKTTLTGNCTYTFVAPVTGSGRAARLQLDVYQDGTGSRVATWPSTVKWKGQTAPTLTTTANKFDIVVFVYNSTNYRADSSLNFSD